MQENERRLKFLKTDLILYSIQQIMYKSSIEDRPLQISPAVGVADVWILFSWASTLRVVGCELLGKLADRMW